MGIELGKQALDVGIVTTNCEKMLSFYSDVLGFEALEPIVFPGVATIHRLVVGESILRLVDPQQAPARGAPTTIFLDRVSVHDPVRAKPRRGRYGLPALRRQHAAPAC